MQDQIVLHLAPKKVGGVCHIIHQWEQLLLDSFSIFLFGRSEIHSCLNFCRFFKTWSWVWSCHHSPVIWIVRAWPRYLIVCIVRFWSSVYSSPYRNKFFIVNYLNSNNFLKLCHKYDGGRSVWLKLSPKHRHPIVIANHDLAFHGFLKPWYQRSSKWFA
jgi:hypothetical protein